MRPDTTFSGPDLCAKSAREVIDLLKKGEVSTAELVDASMTRMDQVEPAVNAVVTRCPDRAMDASVSTDSTLAGLPIGIKDLNPVAGVRTTFGTKGRADFVPDTSDPLVERLEARGGVVLGKTNTPELGAGANTFNTVFGATRNPWNTAMNAGGSSGGAAVSLATGELWLSHGFRFWRQPAQPGQLLRHRRPAPLARHRGGIVSEPGVHHRRRRRPDGARLCWIARSFLTRWPAFDPVWPISYPAPATPYFETARQDAGAVRHRLHARPERLCRCDRRNRPACCAAR